jgi:uncharacterized metal-binding protein
MNYRKDFEPKRRNKMCRPDGRHVLNNQGTDDYVLTKSYPTPSKKSLQSP